MSDGGRFGRKLARLQMPGASPTTVVVDDESPGGDPSGAEPAEPSGADGPPTAASRRADAFAPFARMTRSEVTPRGRGWALDEPARHGVGDDSDAIADDSDAIADDPDAIADRSDAIADDSDAIEDGSDAIAGGMSPADLARKARIARLQARLDEMVGRRQATLQQRSAQQRSAQQRSAQPRSVPEKAPGTDDSAALDPAPAGAWGRLARGASSMASVDAPESGPRRDPDDFSEVPGALEDTDFGPIHIVRETFDPDHCHGQAPVGRALAIPSTEVARFALDPELAAVDLSRALFLDTETTGLYGAGTVPFLIGLGWFEDGCLALAQLFLRRLGEERPMLEFLAERLARASCIITYNGKSFDWPLVCQRFVMNRLPPPPDPLHLDLLHCARRAYKKRIGGARLVLIEERVLGMQRVDDTPGAEIPLIYLDFVRGGPADRIAGVIEHNAHDIVAMAALLGRLGERFAAPRRADDPRDLLSYARIAERAGDEPRAAEFARVAAERSTGSHAADAWLVLARLARRRGDVDGDREGLEAALAEAASDEQSGAAHLGLAKLFEHRLKDYDRALRHAYHTRWMEGSAGWQKRLDRIERKRARRAEAVGEQAAGDQASGEVRGT